MEGKKLWGKILKVLPTQKRTDLGCVNEDKTVLLECQRRHEEVLQLDSGWNNVLFTLT